MAKQVIYEVTNANTGEKVVGVGLEIADKFGVTRSYVSNVEIEGKRLKEHWIVKRVGYEFDNVMEKGGIPTVLLDEFDRITEPFKKLSEKKANRLSKVK